MKSKTARAFLRTGIPVVVILLALTLFALAGRRGDAPQQDNVTELEIVLPALDGDPLPNYRGMYFVSSGACGSCHSGLKTTGGENISIDAAWRGTMMANAFRDPYWQASVQSEIIENPEYQAEIEDKCTTCHGPMARRTTYIEGGQGQLVGKGFISPEHPLHNLAVDGVSCSLCHQIQNIHLGEPESYSGNYEIPDQPLVGERSAYGHLPVSDPLADVMQNASGFVPVKENYVTQSEVCATCHVLHTPTIENGEIVGEFTEQAAYLEWEHSDFRTEASCQDCHMAPVDGQVNISNMSTEPKEPFYRHSTLSANVYMARVMWNSGEELDVTADGEHFEMAINRAMDMLQMESARVTLENLSVDDDILTAEVALENLAGHKFPSGFPSRRAWIHLKVLDSRGSVIFESGAFNDDGMIIENDNDRDPEMYEPHYTEIVQEDQVQIYEPILGAVNGDVTTTLLRASGYLKDNRMLPRGFDKGSASPDVTVSGAAAQDDDFTGGSDRVRYVINLDNTLGPFIVQAELLYQTVGYRWLDNLRVYEEDGIIERVGYMDAVPNIPMVVAAAEGEIR